MSTFTVHPLYPGLLDRLYFFFFSDSGSNYVAAIAEAGLSTHGSPALDSQVFGTTDMYHHVQSLHRPLFMLNLLLKLAYFWAIFPSPFPTSFFHSGSAIRSWRSYSDIGDHGINVQPFLHIVTPQTLKCTSDCPPQVCPWPLDSKTREL